MYSEKWIVNLKPGDKVFVERGFFPIRVDTVKEITPSGLVKVGDSIYNTNGTKRGEKDSFYKSRITEYNTEHHQRLIVAGKKMKDVLFLQKFNWNNLTPEILESVIKIINEETNGEH